MYSKTSQNAHRSSADAEALFVIAEAQRGYFTTAQAAEAGYSRNLVAHHAKAGNFSRVRQGVYRLSRFPSSPREDLYVAWLSAGPLAVVSHDSALELFGLSDAIPRDTHITMPRGSSRRRPGIRMHTSVLAAEDVTRREGLPVTTAVRTIADLARVGFPTEHLQRAVSEALERGMVTEEQLARQSSLRGGRLARLLSPLLEERKR